MGHALALIALAALQTAPEPPPRGTLAGLRALETTSTIVYASRPEPAHVLRATYAFPARSRWAISADEGGSTVRTLTYVRGAAAAVVDAGRGASRTLEDADAHEVRAQAQMRLALFLWPQSHAWVGEGTERRCEFERGEHFRATLPRPQAATPIEIAWCDRDGRVIDAFRAVTWRAEGARSWPASFELWHRDALVWNETVESIDTKLRVVESFFVPPDRRDAAKESTSAIPGASRERAPRAMDVPGAWTSRTALPPGTTFDAALEAESRARTAAGKELEPSLEATRTIEIDLEGRPNAVVLRARGARAPGAGWTYVAEAPAWTMRIADARAPLLPELSLLESALPKDSRRGATWLRVVAGGRSGGVLVMALGSAD